MERTKGENEMAASERIKVVCMECGKKWATSNLIPECPKCGAVDVEPRDNVTVMRMVCKNGEIAWE